MQEIKHPFNEAEATQIAYRVVDAYGGHINFFRLMKLLYVIEGRTWSKFGMPAMGGEYWSLEDGPMISEASNASKKKNFQIYKFWNEHLSERPFAAGNEVITVKNPGRDEIPDGVLEIIDHVISETRAFSNEKLKGECHALKEYRKPPVNSRLPIAAEDILKAAGKSDAEIGQLQSESASWTLLKAAIS